jgi:hypothetical protein
MIGRRGVVGAKAIAVAVVATVLTARTARTLARRVAAEMNEVYAEFDATSGRLVVHPARREPRPVPS